MITDYLKAGYPSNLPEVGKELKSVKKKDTIERVGTGQLRSQLVTSKIRNPRGRR